VATAWKYRTNDTEPATRPKTNAPAADPASSRRIATTAVTAMTVV
jgi:hypothetical protein